ncbi:MAG: hypothetical protein L7S72_07940 [Flavobacteriales bacterium]|nr:hypothetical protein [Flavobacteriales bacterium]
MSAIKTSAFGVARYPHLNKPDTEFSAEGIYQVKLIVNKEEAQEDIKIIDDVIKEQIVLEGKKQPNKTDQFQKAPLPYQDLGDGTVQFNFKTKFKPTLVDHNLESIDKNIWGGSIIRCNYKPVGYYVAGTGLGCTLRLVGVQVKKLVEGSLGTTGFSTVEAEQPSENY